MRRCAESDRVQDWLDGLLAPDEALRFRAHLDRCPDCAAEVALFRRVFEALEGAPLLEPRARLERRILERVLPSRARRRRRLAALGWGYAAALAACGLVIGALAALPGWKPLLEAVSVEASRRLVGVGLVLLNGLGASVLRLAEGWAWARAAAGPLASLARALGAVLSLPAIGLTLWAAAAACAALLWWLRPYAGRAAKEARHVGVLGF